MRLSYAYFRCHCWFSAIQPLLLAIADTLRYNISVSHTHYFSPLLHCFRHWLIAMHYGCNSHRHWYAFSLMPHYAIHTLADVIAVYADNIDADSHCHYAFADIDRLLSHIIATDFHSDSFRHFHCHWLILILSLLIAIATHWYHWYYYAFHCIDITIATLLPYAITLLYYAFYWYAAIGHWPLLLIHCQLSFIIFIVLAFTLIRHYVIDSHCHYYITPLMLILHAIAADIITTLRH